MRAAILLLALPVLGYSLFAQNAVNAQAPYYTTDSIVNAASNFPGPLAPNAIASLYGQNLSWNTLAVSLRDVAAGKLPQRLPGAGVTVSVAHLTARLYFVSPGQINFLLPANLKPGDEYDVIVMRDSLAGQSVKVRVERAAPGVFLLDTDTVVATRPDGSVVTRDAPAHPGDIVVLYASGLGQTAPLLTDGEIPLAAREIVARSEFTLLADGVVVDDSKIRYAGVTPGFAGLYQVNLVLPDDIGDDPEIRLSVAGITSPAGPRLPVRR
ncbi:MAG: hypothetical protein ABI693_02595 [Bryobacteraceae bacterium]